MLKDKITGFMQKDSRYILSNNSNNERTLLAKTQNALLDFERTKGKFETYGPNSENVGPSVKLEGGEQKKTDHTLVVNAIKELKENNHVELDKIVLTEKESQRKMASKHLQAKLIPVAEAVRQQKKPKASTQSKTQLVNAKKLASIKTKQNPRVGQETWVKKSLIKQSQHVQADLHAKLEAGLAAGKIRSVVPSYI